MRWTTTLILVVLVLTAWWCVRYFQENEPEPEPARSHLIDDEILLDFESAELSLFSKERIRIVRRQGGKFEMEFGSDRVGNRFIYTDAIDLNLALQFLRSVDDSRREELVGEGDEDNLLRLNLKPPKYSMKITGGGRSQEIHFGADDPSSAGSIMALDVEDGRIFRVGRQVANILDLNMLDFRDRRVFTLDSQSVDEVEISRLTELDGRVLAAPTLIVAKRSGRGLWVVTDGENEYKADANKVRGLIQRLTTLRIHSFKGQDFKNPELERHSGLPGKPVGYVGLTSGNATEALLVGRELAPDQIAGILDPRDENMTFSVELEAGQKILETSLDSLRYKRLAPAFESSLVALQSAGPDGTLNYRVERAERHPRGPWAILDQKGGRGPGVHEGSGEYSWPQLIAELDRLEVLEFLPPDAEFEPEVVVRVEWMNKPVIRDVEFELARRGDKVIARASDRKNELLVVPELLWEVAHLELDRYLERSVFPSAKDFGPKVRRLQINGRGGLELDLKKSAAQEPYAPKIDNLADVTQAVSLLYGCRVDVIHPADAVPEGAELDAPRLIVEITTTDGQYTLEIGGENPDGTHAYAHVFPKFEGLVVEIQLRRVQELLDLDPPAPGGS